MSDKPHFLDQLGGNKVIAEALAVAPNVVANWKERGIPWKRRHVIAQIAAKRRVPLPENFWEAA
jgi:uncharacterized protein YjcR